MNIFVVGYAYCPFYQRVVTALTTAKKAFTSKLVTNHDDLVSTTKQLCAGKHCIGTSAETSPQIVVVQGSMAVCIPSAEAFSQIGPDGLDEYIASAVVPVYVTHSLAS